VRAVQTDRGRVACDRVVVAAGASDLAKYHVEDAGFAFFLSQRARETASLVLKKNEALTADQSAAVMKLLAEKAGADKQ